MTSAFSSQNSISLWPASFCTPRPNLPVTPGVSWLPTFAFQSPIMKRTSFFGLVLEGLVGLHRTIQLQLLQYYWSGHRLGLLWCWMVCLGCKQIILSFLRLHPSTAFQTLLLTVVAFGVNKLKWIGWVNLTQMTIISTTVGKLFLNWTHFFPHSPILNPSLSNMRAWIIFWDLGVVIWEPFS